MPPQPSPASPERPRVRLVEVPLPPHMGFGYVTRNIVEVEPPAVPIDGLAADAGAAPEATEPHLANDTQTTPDN